jgi:hypothetical protein
MPRERVRKTQALSQCPNMMLCLASITYQRKGATLSHFVVNLAVCSFQVFRAKIGRMLCYDVMRGEMQGRVKDE